MCLSKRLNIYCDIPGIQKKDTRNDSEKKLLALELIHLNYAQESWIHVYTDGSADEAIQNGGAGIYIQFPGGNDTTFQQAFTPAI